MFASVSHEQDRGAQTQSNQHKYHNHRIFQKSNNLYSRATKEPDFINAMTLLRNKMSILQTGLLHNL